ncbi:unnamed protein product, partial [Brassica napus]
SNFCNRGPKQEASAFSCDRSFLALCNRERVQYDTDLFVILLKRFW